MSEEILRRLSEQDKLLARIDERTANMAEKFDAIDKRLDSHAGKIRGLEHWRWKASGAGIALLAIQDKIKAALGL